MKELMLKGAACIFLVVLLVMPVQSGVVGESMDATVYRVTPSGIEEIKTTVNVKNGDYNRAVGEKCRELFEKDSEMQQYAGRAMLSKMVNPFGNATLCTINSSGRGVHMQIILKQWLFDIILNQVVSFLNSMGLENIADAILEIIDEFDLENEGMNVVMRSRYWSADSVTVIQPLMGEPLELDGSHKLITVGFAGYVSYSRLCRIGFAEYYGFALMVLWK